MCDDPALSAEALAALRSLGLSSTRRDSSSSSDSDEEEAQGGAAAAAAAAPPAVPPGASAAAGGAADAAAAYAMDADFMPKNNATYHEQGYWDARFEEEAEKEWLASFAQLESLLRRFVAPSDRILMVGCGNSPFSQQMYAAGFENIHNIDFSEVVVRKMAARHAEDCPNMTWAVMDMTKISAAAASFDVVLDKAAMDALMTAETDRWNPSAGCLQQGHDMCSGVARVLRRVRREPPAAEDEPPAADGATPPQPRGGVFLQVSFDQPHFRKRFLLGPPAEELGEAAPAGAGVSQEGELSAAYGWRLTKHDVEVGLGYFLYCMAF